jgi:hypothetical protein
MMAYIEKPESPFRDAIKLISGGIEPPDFVRGYSCADLTEDEYQELTTWLLDDGLPEVCSWTTGIGLIEAAEHIVNEAVSNGNIPPPPEGRDNRPTDPCPPLEPPEDDEKEMDDDDEQEGDPAVGHNADSRSGARGRVARRGPLEREL